MSIISYKWQDKENDYEKLKEILFDSQQHNFNNDSKNSPYYKNIIMNKKYDKDQVYSINSDEFVYNVLDFSFDKIEKKNESSLINEDLPSNVQGFVIIYKKKDRDNKDEDNKVNYIINKNSGSQNVLRNLLNYSGKQEIISNAINVSSNFIIWLIKKVYDNENKFSVNKEGSNETELTITSVIGFKGNTEDKISKVTADGNTVMKLMSSLTFLLESEDLVFIKLKVSTTNHRAIIFKLQKNGAVDIDIDNYRGSYLDGTPQSIEDLPIKLFLLIYLEIIPILNKWHAEDKDNNLWNDSVYNAFLNKLGKDLKSRIEEARKTDTIEDKKI